MVTRFMCKVILEWSSSALGLLLAMGLSVLSAHQAAGADGSAPSDPRSVTQAEIRTGTLTSGGLIAGSQLLLVSNLADRGPGSLRAALATGGPRIIVFTIGGTIRAQSDVVIREGRVTVAGQTAPYPGVTLAGATLKVAAPHVVLQHMAIRPGRGVTPEDNAVRDGLSIGSIRRGAVHDVLVENVSVSWAVDELVSIWGPGTRRITLRHGLLAEALDDAGHPKGRHSMGLLLHDNVEAVTVAGTLFSSNRARNPVVSPGVTAVIANNYIYNPGHAALHVYGHPTAGPATKATFLSNTIDRGSDTHLNAGVLRIPVEVRQIMPDAQIYVDGLSGTAVTPTGSISMPPGFALAARPPALPVAWRPFDGRRTRDWVLRYAGTRPGDRDPHDRRIVEAVTRGEGAIVSVPPHAGRSSASTPPAHDLVLPDGIDARQVTASDVPVLRAWLCRLHLDVGGPHTQHCPGPAPVPGPVQAPAQNEAAARLDGQP